jgi:hypothetical protein
MPNPPAVAEALLRVLLPVDVRESVSGDLLEEYRESRIPALGELRANIWYWRQVGGIWLRAYWWLVVLVVLLLLVHDVFNTFRAPSGASYLDGLPKLALAAMSPLGVLGLLGLASGYGSWRTQRWEGGLVAALGVSVVAWLFMAVWWNATLYPFAQVQQSNPYWIHAWRWSTHRAAPPSVLGFNPDTPEETFLRWVFWDNVGALFILGIAMLVGSCVCGGIGSTLGVITSRWRPSARQKP